MSDCMSSCFCLDGLTIQPRRSLELEKNKRRVQSEVLQAQLKKNGASSFTKAMRCARELRYLLTLPEEEIDAYLASNKVMGQEKITSRSDEDAVADWYRVLNHFCAIGNVEKMYIAPTIDPSLGNVENQILFETGMADTIGAEVGANILDLGCGKGRIANEVATYSGARVFGLNYDATQIDDAQRFAEKKGLLGTQLDFKYGSFNDPLPYESGFFTGAYEVGAFCYVIDKVKVFSEIYRVLKPGGRFSYNDWVSLNYDPDNAEHRELLRQVKPLTGMVEMPRPEEVEDAFKAVGFVVESSGEASDLGNQLASLIGDADRSFRYAQTVVNLLKRVNVLPSKAATLWDTMRDGGEALAKAVELNLFSMSYQIVVRKPEPAHTFSSEAPSAQRPQ